MVVTSAFIGSADDFLVIFIPFNNHTFTFHIWAELRSLDGSFVIREQDLPLLAHRKGIMA